ncbi:MAG: AAA family ATPase [Bacteroidetes bacterium]|nr:AAA family ATPase [Bacteroidota bacterium]
MTYDQHTARISVEQQVSRHTLPTLQYFLFSQQHIFPNSILASRTFDTFGFARHTNRPFAKPNVPNFPIQRKKFSERHTLAFHASTFVAEIKNKESMQTNNLTLKLTTDRPFELAKTSAKMTISEVFSERKGSYLNEFTLFVAHFNAIPNFIHEVDIDCKKANFWFLEYYKSEIKDFYYDKRYFNRSKKAEIDDIFYFLYDDLIVAFDTNCSTVRFLYRKTELSKVEELINAIHKFKRRKQKQKPEISLLVNSIKGIETKSLKITKPKLSIEDNYNEDFKEIHQTILKRLSRKNDKGLVLLHGKPGTGKTSYIRYLIASLKKDVIFLPPNMASAITNPSLISILIDNPNSIFIIEDAENIVVDREKDGSSPVSVLLNISDGLLADCLNVQIVCSFNTDISKIDSALVRKGRLIAKYEFKELEIEKAQRLSNKLGFDTNISKPMTLTSIYNQDEKDFQQSRKNNPIGFKAINNNRLAEN